MIRVSNEIIELVPQLNRLAREGKPIAGALQDLIDRLTQDVPAEPVGTPHAELDSRSSAAPDPGLAAVMERLWQMEQAILDRIEVHQATPAGLALLDELIDRLDSMIDMPKMCRIRLNSRLFDDFPLESHDRREVLRVPTNKDYDLQEKWLPVLQAKLQPHADRPDQPVSLIYLDKQTK
ncbi:hypothetical protein NDI45_12860 [Leptolyngbya sp. GB1-A1]|uniref:hypothetical protein n=1 Tax=Leptolyngbya sp. GB1-A1 TaxID=2933908 RepID=UPI003296EEC1